MRLEHQVAHCYPDVYDNRYELKDVDEIKIHFLLLGFRRLSYKGLQSNVLYATTKSLLANADYDRIHLLPR